MGPSEKVRENKARRRAIRQGYRLVKSGRRDPQAYDFGVYWIVEPNPTQPWPVPKDTPLAGQPVLVTNEAGITLEKVEAWLDAGDVARRRARKAGRRRA